MLDLEQLRKELQQLAEMAQSGRQRLNKMSEELQSIRVQMGGLIDQVAGNGGSGPGSDTDDNEI